MSTNLAQLGTLLRMMFRLDFRTRNPLGSRGKKGTSALAFALMLYVMLGCALGFGTKVDGFDPVLRITLLLAITAVYLTFNIIVEYQQILISPTDGDVLYWRPVSSRTLFVARGLHIFLYVNLLSAALLLVPSLLIAFSAPGNVLATWIAFVVAATMNAALTTSLAILLYTVLLHHVSGERLQDSLVWFQVIMSLFVFLGYQTINPLMEKMMVHPASLAWLHFLPTHWFASLPEMVGWQASSGAVMSLAGGVLVSFLVVFYAVQRLAPHYQDDLVAQQSDVGSRYSGVDVSVTMHSGATPVPSCASSATQGWWHRSFGDLVVRGASERAGYDFFLAMLRGDRRLKTSLLPLAVLPIAFLVSGLAQGLILDPYVTAVESTVCVDIPKMETAMRMTFMAAYVFTFMALTLTYLLSVSTSWRAAWVFYVAPLAHFDRFYRGIIWGATAGLLLPTILSLVVLLLVMWRDPMHVLLHLSIPVGLTLLVLPLALWARPAPPFSREAFRHDRTRSFFLSTLFFLPLTVIGIVHYLLRGHGWILLLAGSLLAATGIFLWKAVQYRARTVLHKQSFGG